MLSAMFAMVSILSQDTSFWFKGVSRGVSSEEYTTEAHAEKATAVPQLIELSKIMPLAKTWNQKFCSEGRRRMTKRQIKTNLFGK